MLTWHEAVLDLKMLQSTTITHTKRLYPMKNYRKAKHMHITRFSTYCSDSSVMASAIRLGHSTLAGSDLKMLMPGPICRSLVSIFYNKRSASQSSRFSYSRQKLSPVAKSSQQNDSIVSSDNNEDGVSLGTMKLPSSTDLQRFETLLFQWANSLCQGANLPLPVPLKVDKIANGARLGFITIGDGKTEVLVYIDCLVFPATSDSGPIFRAIRNGPLKDEPPPGEPRIMRSLLQALQKSVEIARL